MPTAPEHRTQGKGCWAAPRGCTFPFPQKGGAEHSPQLTQFLLPLQRRGSYLATWSFLALDDSFPSPTTGLKCRSASASVSKGNAKCRARGGVWFIEMYHLNLHSPEYIAWWWVIEDGPENLNCKTGSALWQGSVRHLPWHRQERKRFENTRCSLQLAFWIYFRQQFLSSPWKQTHVRI